MRYTKETTKLYQRTLMILLLIVLIPGALTVGAGSSLSVQQRALAQVSVSLSPASVTIPAQTSFTVDIIVDCGTNADGVGTA
ncbi:MAG: hypothetical protein H5T63_04330, partial [Chloroflexi bacterium]|nr:hypothetical protein [Chloroflexota bacterium]